MSDESRDIFKDPEKYGKLAEKVEKLSQDRVSLEKRIEDLETRMTGGSGKDQMTYNFIVEKQTTQMQWNRDRDSSSSRADDKDVPFIGAQRRDKSPHRDRAQLRNDSPTFHSDSSSRERILRIQPMADESHPKAIFKENGEVIIVYPPRQSPSGSNKSDDRERDHERRYNKQNEGAMLGPAKSNFGADSRNVQPDQQRGNLGADSRNVQPDQQRGNLGADSRSVQPDQQRGNFGADSRNVQPDQQRGNLGEDSRYVQPDQQRGNLGADSRSVQPGQQRGNFGADSRNVQPDQQRGNFGTDSRSVQPDQLRGNLGADSRSVQPDQQRGNLGADSRSVQPDQQRSNFGEDSRSVQPDQQRGNLGADSRSVQPDQQRSNFGVDSRSVQPDQQRSNFGTDSRNVQPDQQRSNFGADSRSVQPEINKPSTDSFNDSRKPQYLERDDINAKMYDDDKNKSRRDNQTSETVLKSKNTDDYSTDRVNQMGANEKTYYVIRTQDPRDETPNAETGHTNKTNQGRTDSPESNDKDMEAIIPRVIVVTGFRHQDMRDVAEEKPRCSEYERENCQCYRIMRESDEWKANVTRLLELLVMNAYGNRCPKSLIKALMDPSTRDQAIKELLNRTFATDNSISQDNLSKYHHKDAQNKEASGSALASKNRTDKKDTSHLSMPKTFPQYPPYPKAFESKESFGKQQTTYSQSTSPKTGGQNSNNTEQGNKIDIVCPPGSRPIIHIPPSGSPAVTCDLPRSQNQRTYSCCTPNNPCAKHR